MNADQHALELWRAFAPRFRMALETHEGACVVTALDDAHSCWIQIAEAPDVADAIVAACGRLHGETPLVVAHLAPEVEGS